MKTTLVCLFFVLGLSGATQAACSSSETSDRFGNSILFYDAEVNTSSAALILPPTGGENFTDKSVAASLCQRGLSAYILNYKQDAADPADLDSHDRIANEVLQWVDQLLASHPDTHFVILGASLGSLYASIANSLAIQPNHPLALRYPHLRQIDGAVLTVCGGSLAEILATSQLQGVVDQRNARQGLLHFQSAAEYQAILEKKIQIDPLALAQVTERNRVLMFTSSTDIIVPAATQNNLWHALGEPERETFGTNHVWTVARTYLLNSGEIFSFAKKILNLKEDPPSSFESDGVGG